MLHSLLHNLFHILLPPSLHSVLHNLKMPGPAQAVLQLLPLLLHVLCLPTSTGSMLAPEWLAFVQYDTYLPTQCSLMYCAGFDGLDATW